MLYQYHILETQPNEIRLLDLLPSQDRCEPIQCRMRHARLASPGAYFALSYTWGDARTKNTIFVDGRELLVTDNLHGFLKQQRVRSGEQMTTLWIDAVCINQGDDAEKANQVPLMGDIYAAAKEVLIWVGDADEDSRGAFQFMLRWIDLLRRLESLGEDVKTLLGPTFDHPNPSTIPGYDLSTEPHFRTVAASILQAIEHTGKRSDYVGFESTGCLRRFLERTYWGRMWTLQERVLASNARVLCGDSEIDMRAIYITTHILKTLKRYAGEELREADGERRHIEALLDNAVHAEMEARAGQIRARNPFDPRLRFMYSIFGHLPCTVPGKNRSVWDMVRLAMRLECTNPKDKLYGLLGMLEDRGRELIHVDYKMSDRDVYMRFTASYMQHTQSLDMLAFSRLAPSGGLDSVLPSWVPNFARVNTLGIDVQSFDASAGQLPPDTNRVCLQRSTLKVKAMMLATVTDTSGTPVPGEEASVRLYQWIDLLANAPPRHRHFLSQSNQTFASKTRIRLLYEALINSSTRLDYLSESLETILLQSLQRSILVAAYQNGGQEAVMSIYSRLNSALELEERALNEHISELQGLSSRLDSFQDTLSLFTGLLTNPRGFQEAEYQINGHIYMLINNRRRLLILDAPYIGFSTENVEPRDKVYILLGCRLPILLRPLEDSQDTFRVIGPVTIPGIDCGQLVVGNCNSFVDVTLV